MSRPWPPRGPDDLDDARRARMRREVLAQVTPRGPSAADHAYAVIAVLAAPAPYIMRAVVVIALVLSVVASATVASTDALPEEPLYSVKVASEQLRLALARSPEDRAAVQLSMAEHRLAEAERLALAGREADALVATSAYATHLATAAAELAIIEQLEPNGRQVVEQLRGRLDAQQQRAADVAQRLAADPASAVVAPVFETVASAPPPQASGVTVAERIAEHAANVNEQLEAVTQQRVEETAAEPSQPPQAVAPIALPAVAPTQAPIARVEPVRTPAPTPVRTVAPVKPASTPAATAAIGNVTAPDVQAAQARAQEEQRKLEEAQREAARLEAEKKAAEKAQPQGNKAEFNERLQKIRKDFLAALEKVKQQRDLARKAADDAKKAAKKTASPKPVPTKRP